MAPSHPVIAIITCAKPWRLPKIINITTSTPVEYHIKIASHKRLRHEQTILFDTDIFATGDPATISNVRIDKTDIVRAMATICTRLINDKNKLKSDNPAGITEIRIHTTRTSVQFKFDASGRITTASWHGFAPDLHATPVLKAGVPCIAELPVIPDAGSIQVMSHNIYPMPPGEPAAKPAEQKGDDPANGQ